jgi:hypothetical protein
MIGERRREGRNRDEGEGGRRRGEGCVMGIALVGYCRTHHNCPCPRTWHHCPSYILAEKCLAPPLVRLRRYKLLVGHIGPRATMSKSILYVTLRTLLASDWPDASKTESYSRRLTSL